MTQPTAVRRPRVAGERRRPAPERGAGEAADEAAGRAVITTTSRTSSMPLSHEKRADAGRRVRAGRRVPTWALAALAALVVLAVAVAGVLLVQQRRADDVRQARGEAVGAARSAAATVLSYDYRHLDRDFAAGKALTTGAFAGQYARTTQDAVRQVATETKATVKAQVVAASVVTGSAHQVTVLTFVNQTTTSNRLQRPQVDQNRVELTMREVGGRWLVAQVRAL